MFLKLKLSFIFFFIFSFIYSQDPINWSSSIEEISNNNYKITFKAKIQEKWHLYAANMPEDGPEPTSFIYDFSDDQVVLDGSVFQTKPKTEYDPYFDMELSFFENSAVFSQKIIIKDLSIGKINGEIQYQSCDDKVCVFRTHYFELIVDESKIKNSKQLIINDNDRRLTSKLYLDLKNKELLDYSFNNKIKLNSFWNLFLLGLLGGFIALLTPCVFPMIPLTVSFFINQSSSTSRGIFNAFIYGFFIIVIYMSFSLPFYFFETISPDILNKLSTDVILNLVLFFVFTIFAFSFFGYFDLSLPSSWGNKADSSSSLNNFLGIFFMALTLAIVTFSCTGPILGSLLVGSITSSGGAVQLTAGMTGFGVALALPFAFFALFPNVLSRIPKTGIWMKNIKVILGFFEIALALKFLSNADLVSHWGILPREIFISLWILISLLTSFYLLGLYKFPHEDKNKPGRLQNIFGLFFMIISIWLSYGLISKENKLKLLSGLLPPEFYTLKTESNNCPLNLNCYKDYESGLKVAKQQKKPMLIDFTGWACVNCRRVEENVWSESRVYNLLSNEVVLVSLYVDDRKKLPINEQFNFEYKAGKIKKIETIGEKWSTFQNINFATNSQPYYVLISPDGFVLNSPIQFTDKETYYNWLKVGLKKFKE